jgi:uncharacterized protein (UPF0335 family)
MPSNQSSKHEDDLFAVIEFRDFGDYIGRLESEKAALTKDIEDKTADLEKVERDLIELKQLRAARRKAAGYEEG